MEFLDLKKQYQAIKPEIDKAVFAVLDSGRFIGGEEVEKFEEEVAQYCGANFAVSVNSGTDALFFSLKALGIGPGDEVITTPFTFIATGEVIANLGAKPVFVDIDLATFNIDATRIEEKITTKTKAILPVHLFGQAANMSKIMTVAQKHNLKVIEDAAQAFGSEYRGQKVGAIGDCGCFSFFPSKSLGAYGDGGMIITNSEELAGKLKFLKNHGSSPDDKYKNLILGYNSRLDSLQATILRVKLKHIDKWNKARQEKANYYTESLKKIGAVKLPEIADSRDHIFHQYTIKVKDRRDELSSYLKENNIPNMVYYKLPLHRQPAFEYLGYKKGDLSVVEKASEEVLSLPIYPELAKEEQDLIIKSIFSFIF